MAEPGLDHSERAAAGAASPPEPPQWGMLDALLGWVIAFGCAVVTLSLALGASGAADYQDLTMGWFVVAQVGLWAGLLGSAFVIAWRKGNGPVADFGLRVTWGDVPRGALWAVLAQLVIIPVLYIPIWELTSADPENMSDAAEALTGKAHSVWGVVLLIVGVGLVAPVVEEIFYRGLVQRAMQRRFGAWPGVVATSVIFGAAHQQALQLVALVIAGLVFGGLAYRAGRLGPAIVAHVVFNMVTVINLVWISPVN